MKAVSFDSTRSRPPWHLLGSMVVTATLIVTARSATDTLTFPMQPLLGPEQHLVFSPWTKVCLNQESGNVERCYTGKNGRTDSGSSFVAAVVIDSGADTQAVLRVTLPLGMQLPQGTWIAVDQSPPKNAPYIFCVMVGCIADYQVSGELINTLKRGKDLVIRGVDAKGQLVNLVLPLVGFAKAYEGPSSDPKMLGVP